jgi:hypothetical protein
VVALPSMICAARARSGTTTPSSALDAVIDATRARDESSVRRAGSWLRNSSSRPRPTSILLRRMTSPLGTDSRIRSTDEIDSTEPPNEID